MREPVHEPARKLQLSKFSGERVDQRVKAFWCEDCQLDSGLFARRRLPSIAKADSTSLEPTETAAVDDGAGSAEGNLEIAAPVVNVLVFSIPKATSDLRSIGVFCAYLPCLGALSHWNSTDLGGFALAPVSCCSKGNTETPCPNRPTFAPLARPRMGCP